MKWNPLTRRHFLQGAAASLSLPLLESLFPEKVWAQLISAGTQKNFIAVPAWNGMFRMYGANSQLMPKTDPANGTLAGFSFEDLAGKHRIHYKSLIELKDA